MKLVLDSHTLLWTLYEPRRLPAGVAAAIADSLNQLYVSHVSVLELTDKAAKFRLPSAGLSVERILGLGVTMVPIELADIAASVKLPRHHDDPFDRLLIAQAQARNLVLVSKDAEIAKYDVMVLWK